MPHFCFPSLEYNDIFPNISFIAINQSTMLLIYGEGIKQNPNT